MSITIDDIEHIAQLARISLEGEKEKFQRELESILAYIKQLEEIDTSLVDLSASDRELADQFRRDTPAVVGQEIRERILENAPKIMDDFFRVRAVLE